MSVKRTKDRDTAKHVMWSKAKEEFNLKNQILRASTWIITCETEKTSVELQKAELQTKGNFTKTKLCQANKQNFRISNHLHCFMTEWPVSPESEEGGWTARKDAGGTAQERSWRWDILETSNTGYLLWSHRAWERRMLRWLSKRENESRSGQFRKRTKALLLHAHWAKKRFCRENQFSIYY